VATPVATPAVTPPSNDFVIEPTSVAAPVETAVPPALVVETTASLAAPPEAPTMDLLIEPTSFNGEVPPPPRGSISGLVATALDEPPADLPMLDMGQDAAPVVEEVTIEPIETVQKTGSIEVVEMIETIDVTETVETVHAAEAASAEIPLLEIADAGRDLPPTPVSTPAVDLPMLEPDPIVEVPAPALTDFGSFGVADEAPPNQGFDLLEIESSEGVHALPLDANYVESQPSLIESAPESLLPPMAPEEELVVAPPTRATSTVLANSVELLHARVEASPDDWPLRRQYAEALLDDGQRDAGVAELEATLAGFEATGDLDTAASVAEEIVRLAPGVIKYHQKRVEFAFRANDRMRLAEAYVELADALLKDGQGPKARVVYQRVLEIAPDDLRAQAALETIKEEPAAAAPPPRRSTTAMKKPAAPAAPEKPAAKAAPAAKKDDGDFVSLGDWLREDDEPKSTRMVVEEKEPTGDEQADFADMLRKFKQGVSDNVDEEDHEAHYDLGVAYKEMGLLDEAISEFQKSLRGANNRVRAIEALGQCFVEKGQLPVAATILQRALAEPGIGDDALIGVLYLLGTISEELHLFPDAKKHYQRVFAVDIQFRDIGDRLERRGEEALVTLDARLHVPVAAALREIQAPIRDRLDRVPEEMWRIVQADVAIVEAANAHLRGMRGKLFRPHAAPPRLRGRGRPGGPGGRAGRRRRARAPHERRARRLGGPFGPAARAAHDQRALQPSGRRPHGRLPLLQGDRRARPPRGHGAPARLHAGLQRDDARRAAPARLVRRAQLHRVRLLHAHPGQDGVARRRGLRDGRPRRRPTVPRGDAALRRAAGHGLPGRRRPARLHRAGGGHGEAERQ
jgi:tetratricopeptide (TPR) repeat protein